MPTGASQKLIELAINDGPFKGQGGEKPADVTDKNFHCVIHVLRWSDPEATEKQTVVAQNWYVYNNGNAKGLRSDRIWSQEDFTAADRIYDVKRRKKPATSTEGTAATPDQLNNDLRKHFRPQFTFGVNIPVRAVLATLDKKKE